MRLALTEKKCIEAEPGLKGLCPGCTQPVIAKCGSQRIRHWAHSSDKHCDSWREPGAYGREIKRPHFQHYGN
jgi:competence protein CoiA